MELNYTDAGKFIPETEALIDELVADAIMLLVFGSNKGSGCCCQMRVENPERMVGKIAATLRELADSMENDLKEGKAIFDEDNGHEQALH